MPIQNTTITPTPAAGNSVIGPFPPVAHTHPVTAITGLRFGPTGRVEPVYDSEDVYANGKKIALYEVAAVKARFRPTPVPAVTIVQAIQNVEGDDDNVAGKKQADDFLREGKITKQEYDQLTTTPEPKTKGVAPVTSVNGKTISVTPGDFTMDTVLTPAGTTLGDMIKRVTFPRTIAQLSQGYPGMNAGQIVNNLANLAYNVYEPIRKQYSSAFMTNSFRHGASIGGGQHGTGQAADFQFRGVKSSDYFDIAVWISKNIPYDQLLLEYLPGKTVWIHISYAIPGLPTGGLSVSKSKPQNRLATLNGAAGGKFTPNLHSDIIVAAVPNRIVAT
jgi:hypothetical protein